MAWPAVVGAVIGAVGLISSFIGSKKAASAAKEQAAEEARLEGLTTAERQREINKEERQLYGQTLTGYAGGGVKVSPGLLGRSATPIDTPGAIIAEQKKEFGFERKITKDVGATKVQQALAGGRATAQAYKYQGYSNVASGISSILMNWKA